MPVTLQKNLEAHFVSRNVEFSQTLQSKFIYEILRDCIWMPFDIDRSDV